jgi:hypothetical protein
MVDTKKINKRLIQAWMPLVPDFLSLLIPTLPKGLRRTPQMSHAVKFSSLSYVQMEQRQTSCFTVSRFNSSSLPIRENRGYQMVKSAVQQQ